MRGEGFTQITVYRAKQGLGRFVQSPSDGLRLVAAGRSNQTIRFYDTFDWRLFHRGLALQESAGRLSAVAVDSNRIRASAPVAEPPKRLLWWDLPRGRLRDLLRPVLGVRAACPVATLHRRARDYQVLNGDGKTIGRLRAITARTAGSGSSVGLPKRVVVEALKGYKKEMKRLATALASAGWAVEERPELELAVAAAGRRVLDYSSRPQIHLEPTWSAAEGMRVIMRRLVDQMRRNEQGLFEDLDVEFLHDFRVAIRRLRSLLATVKNVSEPGLLARLKADFRAIANATGSVRDLDVLLLNHARYRTMLPASLHPGLDVFFERLSEERARAFQAMVARIGSPWYRDLIAGWEDTLEAPLPQGERGQEPLVLVARRSILKRLGDVGKRLQAISRLGATAAEVESLHALRIDCKKLRYLYETFASFFPGNSLKPLVKSLKVLQDYLGAYNDLVVQQARLESQLAKIGEAGQEVVEMAAAIGGVTVLLAEEQQVLLAGFRKAASRFKDRKHRETVREALETSGA
jgi:CHAD domain-containing protein